MYIAINLKIMTIFRITIHYYLLYIFISRCSICVNLTAITIRSYVPTEPFLTNNISFVIGGTMLIVRLHLISML